MSPTENTEQTLPRLSEFDVLAFDVYGTLVDWDAGLSEALQPLLAKYPQIRSQWSDLDALHAFESVERDLQVRDPTMLYPDLLARSHEILEERIRALVGAPVKTTTLEGSGIRAGTAGETSVQGPANTEGKQEGDAHVRFGNSIPSWPLFPDTHDALQRLAKHFKLVVLSNVDRNSFSYSHVKLAENTTSAPTFELLDKYDWKNEKAHPDGDKYWFPRQVPGSRSPFTMVLTAQDVGSYKPALHGFERTLNIIQGHPLLLGSSSPSPRTRSKEEHAAKDVKDRVLWVSCSLYADINATHQLGVKSAFIDRGGFGRGDEATEGGKKWTWHFRTVGELADAVERELAEAEKAK